LTNSETGSILFPAGVGGTWFMKTAVLGTGSYLPDNIVSNDDLAKYIDTSDEWISSRTGIRTRHISMGETTAELTFKAAQEALKNSNVKPEELGLIIVATITGDYITPSMACVLQKQLGAGNAFCFDINAACSGFLYAVNTAHLYIQAGIVEKALVIGAEVLSKVLDWSDRSTCVLFGDGAGAAVLGKGDHGICDFLMGSDGTKGDALVGSGRPVENLFIKQGHKPSYVHMDGQSVFRFAVRQVPECIERLLAQNDLKAEEIKYFVLHQANIRIIQSVAKRLRLDIEKFPMNLSRCGNTSAASIPVLLAEIDREGKLQRGDKIILSGFGGGLTWGAVLIEW